jgi:hypothetical protein
MDTANFQCGHCGNLMAVTVDLVGQQVRCPHCQQVVLAPVTSGGQSPPQPPAPEPTFKVSGAEEKESIFTPDEQASDDVFGVVPRRVVEMPAPPPDSVPSAPVQPTVLKQDDSAPPGAPASPTPAATENPFAGFSTNAATEVADRPDAGAHWSTTAQPAPWHEAGTAAQAGEPHPDFETAPTVRRVRYTSGWLTIALVIPLISYSILATILVAVLYYQKESIPHPLEEMPDKEGDNVGARRVEMRVKPDMPLPEKLRVALGQSIQVGDLEVTPLRVEYTKVRFQDREGRREESGHPALVLHLQMKNVSDGVAFKPTDPEFLRAWDDKRLTGMPYTFLEMGPRRFYGGPIRWNASNPPGKRADIIIEGHDANRELRPGETMTTLVCTNWDPRLGNHLKEFSGRACWRVQVRRGLVAVKDREVSSTAVIGVEFAKSDIIKL